MKLLLFIMLGCAVQVNAQLNYLEGTWQGIITKYNKSPKDGDAIWFDFTVDPSTGEMKGESRLERPFTDYYAYKNIKGKVLSKREVEFEDVFIGARKNSGRNVWCMLKGTLTYDDSTGYLTGKWSSSDCSRASGEMILYRSKYQLSKNDTLSMYHSWVNNMVNDLKRGWSAYYVRDAEMRDFIFRPVYFDHDKDILKAEFNDYLRQMSQIVNSHSDLRILIIGHTDSNGSDQYNIDLSARRAKRIKQYLVSVGVPEDRIVIEYRGEKDPATSNSTSDGKRLNRRVDFEFI